MKGKFALFCDYALISSDGKLSILGEFSQLLGIGQKPTLNRGFLVGSLVGEAGTKEEIEIKLVDENNANVLPNQKFNIEFGPGGIANILVEIAGLVFNKSGKYKAVFLLEGKTLIEAPLFVVERSQTINTGAVVN